MRHAYEKGLVMVRCEKCHHYHLISDHFGWFSTEQEGPIKPYDSIAIIKFIKNAFEKGVANNEKI